MKKLFLTNTFYVVLLFVLSSLFFVIYSEIDIAFTSLFYNEHAGFFLAKNWSVQLLYHSVKYSIIFTLLLFVGLSLYNHLKQRNILHVNYKKTLFLILVLALGPGLIVNWVFKEHFGRARPINTEHFGATQQFSSAFIISDQCEMNCSFSCGHASGAFFMIAVAMLVHRRRLFYMSLATVYGFAVGLTRIVQGGHFLSDVVVSYFVVFLVSKLLYDYMFEK